MRGFIYSAESAWRRVDVPNGHVIYPAVNPEDPDYGQLQPLVDLAREGENVEAFHVAVAKNIHRTFLRGRYVKGALVGGQLHSARIDARRISIAVQACF